MMTKKWLLIGALLVAVTAVLSYVLFEMRANQLVAVTESQLDEQNAYMLMLADAANTSRSNTTIANTVSDCASGGRRRLDSLLGQLAELTTVEIDRLQQLYAECGDYFARVQMVNVAHLDREFTHYEKKINLLRAIDESRTKRYAVDEWRSVIAKERAHAEAKQELVTIQGEIIDVLESGAELDSDSIQELLTRAQNTRELIEVVNQESDALREQLRNS